MNVFRKSAPSIKPAFGMILILLMLGAVLPAAAQDASAVVGTTDCYAEDDTAYINFELDVFFRRNEDVTVAAWPRFAEDDELILSEDPDYEDRDGFIVTADTVTLLYDNAHWDAFRLEIPSDAFPSGDYDFYMEIEIYDEDGNLIEEHSAFDCSFFMGDGGSGTGGGGDDPKGGSGSGGSGGGNCESTIALDCNLDAEDGDDVLVGGFLPDPFEANVTAGGRVEVMPEFEAGSTCRGYVTEAPTFTIEYVDAASFVRFYTEGSEDLTMVVHAPDGLWYCDDDTGEGLNPEVSFVRPADGFYYVWIGTYGGGTERTTLLVSEIR